jgi:hypothetical protein
VDVSSAPGCSGRRQVTRLALAVAIAIPAVALFIAPAQADVTYTAHVDSWGFQTTATNSAFPLGLVIEGDAPIATADLSSLGDEQALAAAPYPGSTIASTPGAVGGIYGVPLPNYPLVAAASAGDSTQEQNAPGISLRASVSPISALGLSTIGTAAQGGVSEANIDASSISAGGDLTALGTSRFEGMAVLDLVHLGRVESQAKTVLGPDGKAKSSSLLRIDGIAANGLQFTIPKHTPGSVSIPNPVPGTPQLPVLTFPPTPIPGGGTTLAGPQLGFINGQFLVAWSTGGVKQQIPVPFDTVASAFRSIGVTVTYQAAQSTKTGIIAPTLSFSALVPKPPSNPFGVTDPTPITVQLGRTATSIVGAALPAGPPLLSGGVPPMLSGGEGSPATPGSSTGLTPGGSPGAAGLPLVAGGPPPSVQPRNDVQAEGHGFMPASSISGWFTDLYPLFIIVALTLLVSGRVVQSLGVRMRWVS